MWNILNAYRLSRLGTEVRTMVDQQQAQENVADMPAPEGENLVTAVVTEDDLARQLEEARVKSEQHWNQLLRTRAEMDNLQKRQARELENAHKFALDSLVRELVQVWDSLELGMLAAKAPDADLASLRQGSELTLKLFADVMGKFGVQQLNPRGEPFNPDYHQAMSVQPSSDMEPNRVLTVMQKGCTLNGRLVRPALVVVSKAANAEIS